MNSGEGSAFFRWSHRRVPHRTSMRGSVSMSTESFWKIAESLWAVEVVGHVGLITSGRGCICHKATLFILWIFAGFNWSAACTVRCRWSRIRKTEMECSCTSKRLKMNARCDIMGDDEICLDRHNPWANHARCILKVWRFTSYKLTRFHLECAEEQCMCKPYWHRKLTWR